MVAVYNMVKLIAAVYWSPYQLSKDWGGGNDEKDEHFATLMPNSNSTSDASLAEAFILN